MLPETAEIFFQQYSGRVHGKLWTLKEALEELREAWKAYPEHRARITEMAKVVQVGMKKKPAPVEKVDPLVQNVMETLL